MSQVASSYKEECLGLGQQLLDLMDNYSSNFHPDVRAKLFQALILLRNRGLIDPYILIKLSFRMISLPDKSLRQTLGEYIFNDIKMLNQNKTNEKINRRIQALLFELVAEDTTVAARKSVEILAELYRKKVWTDSRTVNVMACACTSPATRVMVAAVSFFLGIETKMHEDEDEDETDLASGMNFHEHSKKTRKRMRQVKKAQDHIKKVKKDKEGGAVAKEVLPLFPAIQLINNPQTLAEKLLSKLRKSSERFDVKLLCLNFISRLIGCHGLLLLSFYRFDQTLLLYLF